MAYKFQLGQAKLAGDLLLGGGASISGSVANSNVDDATITKLLTEMNANAIEADKLALATNPGLEPVNQGGVEKLQVKADAASGLTKDGAGLKVKHAANGGIRFDGSGDLEIKLNGSSLQLDGSGAGLSVQEGQVNINNLQNAGQKANSSRNIGTGNGLQGGGDLSADRTLSINAHNAALFFDAGNGNRLDLKATIDGARTFSNDVTLNANLNCNAGTIDLFQGVGAGNQINIGPNNATASVGGTLLVGGNLQVNGELVTINASELAIQDKIIQVASGAANAAQSRDSGLQFGSSTATHGARFLYEDNGGQQALVAKQGSGTTLIQMKASSFVGPSTQIDVGNQNGDSETFVVFTATAGGPNTPHTNANLKFDSTNGKLSATSFQGDGSLLTNITAGATKRIVQTANGASNVTVASADMGKILVFTGNVSNGGNGRTVTLPAHNAAHVGKGILIKVSNAAAEPITIARNNNADKIDGAAADIVLQSDNAAVELIYLGNGGGDLEWVIV